MKILAPLLFLVLITSAAIGGSDTAAFNLLRYRAYNGVAFTHIDSVSVSRLDGSRKLGFSRLWTRSFHGYRRISEWTQIAPSNFQTIATALKGRIDEQIAAYTTAGDHDVVEVSSFCIPKPGIAVRLQTEQGQRDFLICLDCGEVVAFGGVGSGVSFSIADAHTLNVAFEALGLGSLRENKGLNKSDRANARPPSFSTPQNHA